MSIRKAKIQTVHGIERIKERTDVSKKGQALKLIKHASKFGASPHSFRKCKRFHHYLLVRAGYDKRVKVYMGFVFIFNGGSDRLITMYPIPHRFKEEIENVK